jgi:hypothetical protein
VIEHLLAVPAVANAFAVTIGSRSAASSTPVPTRIRDVAAAAMAIADSASRLRR